MKGNGDSWLLMERAKCISPMVHTIMDIFIMEFPTDKVD